MKSTFSAFPLIPLLSPSPILFLPKLSAPHLLLREFILYLCLQCQYSSSESSFCPLSCGVTNQYTHLTSLKHPRLDISELSMLFLTGPPSPLLACWCSGFPRSDASTVYPCIERSSQSSAHPGCLLPSSIQLVVKSCWFHLYLLPSPPPPSWVWVTVISLLSRHSSLLTAPPHVFFLLLSDPLSRRKWEILKTYLCSYYFLAKYPSGDPCCFKEKDQNRHGLWSPRASVSTSASSLPLTLATGTFL